ncbi:MAG: MerR family transcriptional regulator [Chloroflexi bacterium]|nr:MerR family transcriptional regulator [Chloroflexota bacterium]
MIRLEPILSSRTDLRMFKIGEFSQLSKVTVKTLRYYADIDLLPPAHIDLQSGYRYYQVDQLPRLNRILALRDLGFSLDQIRRLLDDDLSAEQLRGMLRMRQAQIAEQIETERSRLAQVEMRLRSIEQEGTVAQYDVILKPGEAVEVAFLRRIVPSYDQMGPLFGELFQEVAAAGLTPAGPPMTIYHDSEYKPQNADVEVAVPVNGAANSSNPALLRTLAASEALASCMVQGSYDHISGGYEAMMHWLQDNPYSASGPPREIYLRGPESTANPDEYLTEIQFPVYKPA